MTMIIDGTAGVTFPNNSIQVVAAGVLTIQVFTASGTFTVPAGNDSGKR